MNSNSKNNNNNNKKKIKVKLKEETKKNIENNNNNNIEDISIKSVDIESEILRNSNLDPEASIYLPKKNENEKQNENKNKLNEETKEEQQQIQTPPPVETYDHQKYIENAVQFEVDYHFSDISLSMDNYLLSRMHEDKNYWVSFEIVANLTKIKSITNDYDLIRKAIRNSKLIIFNDNETKVKRPNFIPPKPKQHKDLRRTVFLYGLSNNITIKQIKLLCSPYGNVKKVVLDNPNDTKTIKLDKKKPKKNQKI
jgi:hypothetical protein